MANHSMSGKIPRKHTDDVFYMSQKGNEDKGPPPGLRAGGGTRTYENTVEYKVKRMKRKRTRTSLSVWLFDMVAELAIAER
eukprot:3064497-Amphidinium_carterae.1